MRELDADKKASAPGKKYLGLTPAFVLTINAVLCMVLLFRWELALVGGLMIEGLNVMIINLDFSNYWFAGKLLSAGEPVAVMYHERYFAAAREFFGSEYQWHSWSYPPHYLLLVWPLSFLPYKIALLTFLLSTLAFFVFSCRKIFGSKISGDPRFWSMLLPVVFLNTVATQNGFLTSGFLLLALAFRTEGRHILAGFLLACLTIKPQLGVLIPIYLIMQRDWRTTLSASVFTLAFIVVTALVFGAETWTAYLTVTTQYMSDVMTQGTGIFIFMMPTFFMSARVLGLSIDSAQFIQTICSLISLGFLVYAIGKTKDELTRLFFLTACTILVIPYAFNYDMCAAVALGCAVHLQQCDKLTNAPAGNHNNMSADMMIWLLALLPVFIIDLARVGFPIGPAIIFVSALLLFMSEWKTKNINR